MEGMVRCQPELAVDDGNVVCGHMGIYGGQAAGKLRRALPLRVRRRAELDEGEEALHLVERLRHPDLVALAVQLDVVRLDGQRREEAQEVPARLRVLLRVGRYLAPGHARQLGVELDVLCKPVGAGVPDPHGAAVEVGGGELRDLRRRRDVRSGSCRRCTANVFQLQHGARLEGLLGRAARPGVHARICRGQPKRASQHGARDDNRAHG
mmetsp:Transcript_50586/g.156554  ORF Transcript_50586/g.156554 Transcript_50586/m.156554 type:complete len:209 (+) Transcript_50586:412-1038(+)